MSAQCRGCAGVLILRLRAISGIVHAHHSCGGKREKLSRPVFRPFSNSHQYGFQIRLRLVDISAFSGQNKVIEMCPKYLLTRYYKWSSQYQTLIKIVLANSNNIQWYYQVKTVYANTNMAGTRIVCPISTVNFGRRAIWPCSLVVSASDS